MTNYEKKTIKNIKKKANGGKWKENYTIYTIKTKRNKQKVENEPKNLCSGGKNDRMDLT